MVYSGECRDGVEDGDFITLQQSAIGSPSFRITRNPINVFRRVMILVKIMAKHKPVTALLVCLLTLGALLAFSGRANAQLVYSCGVDPANPHYFLCEAAGPISVPTGGFYEIGIGVDGSQVYSTGKIHTSGMVNIVFSMDIGPYYNSTHTCNFSCPIVGPGIPLTFAWDISDPNQYFGP